MRKVAGWLHLSSLCLQNLEYCLDWGLLRTMMVGGWVGGWSRTWCIAWTGAC